LIILVEQTRRRPHFLVLPDLKIIPNKSIR
jgi:hypothetical protein